MEAGTLVETLLAYDHQLIKEAWCWMQVWYKTDSNRPPPPTNIMLALIIEEYVELYPQVPPPGNNIITKTDPFAINESISLMENIGWEVRHLWRHRSGGGASCIREENLQYWLAAATWEEQPDTANWEQVVEIFQAAFRDCRPPTECM